ncbi:MAG: helix-turn-helix domain-containing protein [Verrucomicrobia bacterium]|nr:helix-turn-helix domain-containing protein [Verrucomicrobiota bacterium]
MSEELKRLGHSLQTKRKELNLSLKEIENATSIRSSYLQAIEEGTVTEYLSGIYAQGFIKQYATFLGLDVDQLVRENPAAFRMAGEKHEFAYGIGTLEVRGSMGGGVKWLPNLLWAGLAAVVLVAAWLFAKFVGLF